jgi:hypothetical protein
MELRQAHTPSGTWSASSPPLASTSMDIGVRTPPLDDVFLTLTGRLAESTAPDRTEGEEAA